ncbi:hypothetical protein AU252_04835 [Pseudarthrobacter sulfonivorans]|uniref:Uncharacterized protein n=1 Tax=Pseudarthrobacter sulfonivorans TaxID=121292 RepID=A0A0U3R5U6_9MICC|nr:hypothetical protein AU252_04835 [Pseudarthrobacter sulfonivorans]
MIDRPVFHHIDLVIAQYGHPLPAGGGLHRLELAEASGLCVGGAAAVDVLADERTELTFWYWHEVRASLCSGMDSITPLLAH